MITVIGKDYSDEKIDYRDKIEDYGD